MRTWLSLWALSGKSLLNRRMTAGLTVFAIAMSVMLFLGVNQLRDSARHSFESTLSGTHLLVGARSGDINLLLYTVFRIGNPTNNMSWQSYQEFASRPEVAWSIPISLGDSHRGYRIVGTTNDYFEHFSYAGGRALEFAVGEPFDDLFDAVLGAEVARSLGYVLDDGLVISHGIGQGSFLDHGNMPFRVSGILRPTGTPVDRAVHISLEGMEAIHVGWINGVPHPAAAQLTADDVRGLDLQPDSITAFLVGMQSPIWTLRLQRDINEYRSEALSAVIPGVAMAQLWQVVGAAETALSIIAAFVVAVGLLGMLTSILTTLNERRREMAILRSVGARPGHVFSLLVQEAGLLAAVGAGLGMILVHAGLTILTPWLETQFGIFLNMNPLPGWRDLQFIGLIVGLAMLLGAIPAWLAYRRSLADGLAIRT